MEPTSDGRTAERGASTAGAWLRAARQQRGLHIAALAVMLKVPQAKLEALEADRFDELPDATFTRALATAMCRALKVDPAPVLALLPRSSHDREFDVRPGLNQPFRERGARPIDGGLIAALARPVVWGPLLLLLLAAAVLYWLPASWLPEREGAAAASAPAASAASQPEPVMTPAPLVAVPEPAASLPGAVAVAASQPLPVASAPLQVREVAPPPDIPRPASAAAASGPLLRISASADSWVEVVDAQGRVVLSRVLRAGEAQLLDGAAAYKLRIGNVGGTRVEWRGAEVDLAARANNNVARLELN